MLRKYTGVSWNHTGAYGPMDVPGAKAPTARGEPALCLLLRLLVVDDLLLCSLFSQPPLLIHMAKAAQGLGQREYRHAHTSYFILKTYFRDTCVRPVHMSADVTEARRG